MSGGTQRKRIGEFMQEKGLIHGDWIPTILEHAKKTEVRFGEAAVALGYVTEKQLRQVLVQPFKNQILFHLTPAFFPQVTHDLLPIDVIIREGVLPLGYKSEFHWFRTRKRLNLGVLNLEKGSGEAWVRANVDTVKAFKTFQILPEEFLQTLELCYGVDRRTLLDMSADQIDVNLALYLQLERRQRPRIKPEEAPKK